MSKIIVIDMQFNTTRRANMTRRLSEEWISHRMKIFMNYTLQSLINQTNQSFLCFIYYDKQTEELVKKEIAKYPKLPENIIFSCEEEEGIYKYIQGYDDLYLVRLDCDDMYHPSFIQQLIDYNPKEDTQALINQKGFVYDILNDKLGGWYHDTPPFHTLIYKVEDYMNGKRYVLKGGHMGAIYLKHEIIDKENYVVTIHQKNTLNTFERHGTKVLNEDEKEKVMKEFEIRKKEDMI
ncbi:hypothetical protein CHF27_009455 [Romboutsia maritimum]|uniref:Glycosyltransferase family 2 protein n=1 Tax=Romboutsia maritimum TaxID=2020948 RepID=A0A371IRR2_9FIRM|nr:glycosyltransferase [Romboutsia maritimum]RDY23166.1 hypothetical protein CHF27_009455 [Romboutsia maritimum]